MQQGKLPMVYAIISDIHGNVEALQAVLSALNKKKVDSIICLGDIVGYYPDPEMCIDLVKKYAGTKRILGVCLGHQAIAEAFGGTLINLDKVYHGVATPVSVFAADDPLFRDLPPRLEVGRYHSWVVSKKNLPGCFTITCEDNKGLIMGISHKEYDVKGVQFHPESVLTEYGEKMMENWLRR